MAFINTTDGAKVVIRWSSPLGYFNNVLWFTKTNFTDTDLQNLVDAIGSYLVAGGFNFAHPDVAVEAITGYDMRSVSGSIRTTTNVGGDGNGLGEILPLKETLVVSLYTAKRGRSHRGRVYVSGFTESSMDSGLWLNSSGTAAAAMLTGIQGAASGQGWEWGVHSAILDGVPRDPQVVTPITNIQVRSQVPSSQRKRTPRP